jgi:ribosomal protein S21
MLVQVKGNNIQAAYRILTKALNKDGFFKELRYREAYETPKAKKLRKHKAAVGRIKKEKRKRDEIFANIESRSVYRSRYEKKEK